MEWCGGGSWIRTNVEIDSADLQSAAIDHSAIPPYRILIEYRSINQVVNVGTHLTFKEGPVLLLASAIENAMVVDEES